MNSQSLWEYQRQSYSRLGYTAWQQSTVPSYLTNTPLLVYQYVQLILTYLKGTKLNSEEPLYILDLGSGSGRFGYIFLKMWQKYAPDINIKYIMTDVIQDNLSNLKEHPYLQNFIENNILEFHTFDGDLTQDAPIDIKISGSNPVVCVANYFFDTIYQDIIKYDDGNLLKCNPRLFNNEVVWDHSRLDYNDTFLKSVVAECCEYSSVFSIPIGALNTISRINDLSKGNFLFLASDQGVSEMCEIKNCDPLDISWHETFSMYVNYNIISDFCKNLGGGALVSKNNNNRFVTGLFSSDIITSQVHSLFRETVLKYSVYDYWSEGNILLDKENISAEELLELLERGHGDPVNFYHSLSLIKKIDNDSTRWNAILDLTKEYFFPLNKDEDDFFKNIDFHRFI